VSPFTPLLAHPGEQGGKACRGRGRPGHHQRQRHHATFAADALERDHLANGAHAATGSDDLLLSLAAVSPTSVWAVGYYNSPTSGTYEPLLLHATGSTVTKNPNPPIADPALLSGASALSGGTVWAVGYTTPPSAGNQTLSMRTTTG
jgi:hypothetical protein